MVSRKRSSSTFFIQKNLPPPEKGVLSTALAQKRLKFFWPLEWGRVDQQGRSQKLPTGNSKKIHLSSIKFRSKPQRPFHLHPTHMLFQALSPQVRKGHLSSPAPPPARIPRLATLDLLGLGASEAKRRERREGPAAEHGRTVSLGVLFGGKSIDVWSQGLLICLFTESTVQRQYH